MSKIKYTFTKTKRKCDENKTQMCKKQNTNVKTNTMKQSKGLLTKLKRELDKYNIKAEAINKAAEATGKTKSMIRMVLNGNVVDKHNIIEFLTDLVIVEKKKAAKLKKKLEALN